ncbi:MAG: hypothetical protein K0S63_207 [Gammaproteobacteria bacterium]|jgi:hypothetical protein|nr:hypothetical protein [Gammaproteobacteria bacterium]
MPAPKKLSCGFDKKKMVNVSIRANEQNNVEAQYARALIELNGLEDPLLLIRYSRKWLEKIKNPRAVRSVIAMSYYIDIANKSAGKAYDYEYQKLIRTGIFNSSFFEASLQAIRVYVMHVMIDGRRDVTKIVYSKSAVKKRKAKGLGAVDKRKQDALNAEKRELLIEKLGAIVQLAFDAEKFKHSLGISIPEERLGEGVLGNKERHAQEVMDEFKKVIKYMGMSENLEFLLEEIVNQITKTKNNVIEAATAYNNQREKILANVVNQTLLQVVSEERMSAPLYATLANLGIFAPASDFNARLGGAETQEYEDDILHLVGEYMSVH